MRLIFGRESDFSKRENKKPSISFSNPNSHMVLPELLDGLGGGWRKRLGNRITVGYFCYLLWYLNE